MKAVLFSIFLLFTQTFLCRAQTLGHGYDFENNGKTKKTAPLPGIYNKSEIPTSPFTLNEGLKKVLVTQKKYLQNRINKSTLVDGLTIQNKSLMDVLTILQSKSTADNISLNNLFDLYQLNGEDDFGNVHFTGYFIPIVKVKAKPDSIFKFPIYERPSIPYDQMPSRNEIDYNGALSEQNLELAYSSSLIDNYFMQVQGSGMVEYPDGSQELLSYGGVNGKGYTSIGKYLVTAGHISKEKISLESIRSFFTEKADSIASVLSRNTSYTFFVRNQTKPVGAANVPLSKGFSIAVDPKFIPLGSILWAKVPKLDENGKLDRHEYRLLFAQDTGGAIKGSGHVDLFFGIGDEAEKKASAMHHYGEIWLLLPKQ